MKTHVHQVLVAVKFNLMYPIILSFIERLNPESISVDRQQSLQLLVDYIQKKQDKNEVVNLNFICTHNSRRSQLAQVWAKVIADYKNIPIHSFSGGVEITDFNPRAVESLKRFGFKVESAPSKNPIYSVNYGNGDKFTPITAYSKLFDDVANPSQNFAAIMTCSHADENCPFVNGCDSRIPIRYNDPKEFDDTPFESQKYDERSTQIATEMLWVFSNL